MKPGIQVSHVPPTPTANQSFPSTLDLHPDEFYKVHSSTSEENACHRGKGPAGTYGAETSDCDTPYSLINATFDWIAENIRDDIDFIVWTGDSARHDSDEQIPRSPAQVQKSNQLIADKFVDLFEDPSGQGLRIPIVATLGNNDILPHNVLLPGPNKWLKRYTDIWGRFIPQEQRHSFEFGGWYYVEVIPNRLAVFSLNTLYFFDRNAGVDDCVNPSEPGFKQLEWLRIQLQFMRERGVKAILMGHIPPARTGSKQLWDETCWQKYTLWLRQYRDVIVSSMYGHMNVDHFLLQDTEEINYNLIGASRAEVEGLSFDDEYDEYEYEEPEVVVRTIMEDEMDVQSTTDYLQELRSEWSKLPKPQVVEKDTAAADTEDGEVDAEKKKKKKKNKKKKGPKLSHKWAERYQLSFVSPSIVPNYLPALRVVEYNITGMEDTEVWTDGPSRVPVLPDNQLPPMHEEKKSKKNKDKKDKKDKDKEKNNDKTDPNLVVPDGPAKTAKPGPAYSPQPLTLRGYTQYFANLTYINNDMTLGFDGSDDDDDNNVESEKWREGDHSDKEPKKGTVKPHKFAYQVEYSTFTDKIYNLSDMTVNSLLEMAYRMGKKTSRKSVADVGDGDVVGVDDDAEDDDDVDADGDFEDAGKKKKDKKKDKKKKKKEQNGVWLHFLRHAFVSSVSNEKLKKISG